MTHAILRHRRQIRFDLADLIASVLIASLAAVLIGTALPSVAGTATGSASRPETEPTLGKAFPNPGPATAQTVLRSNALVIQVTEKPSISTSSPPHAVMAAPATASPSMQAKTTIGSAGTLTGAPLAPGTPSTTTARTAGEVAGGLGQVALVLVLIVGLIALMAWLLRRLGVARVGTGNLIRVVSSVALGNRERIMVLEIADQWIVVGVTAATINTLTTMPRQEHSPGTGTFAMTPVGNNFAFWLKRTMEKRSRSDSENGANSNLGRHGGPGKSTYGANNDSGTIDGI